MRINLAVPFSQKDEAKRLGARWDFDCRVWYVENPDDLAPFMRWLNLEAPHVEPSSTPPLKAKRSKARAPAKLEIRKGERITGKDYRPSCGQCDVPPWEACACSEH